MRRGDSNSEVKEAAKRVEKALDRGPKGRKSAMRKSRLRLFWDKIAVKREAGGRKSIRKTRLVLLGISAVLLVAVSICFWLRAYQTAVVTFYPAWMWAVGGLVLAMSGAAKKRATKILVILGWLVFAGVFAEEIRSLARGAIAKAGIGSNGGVKRLRVVSLNCAGGNPEAAEEVIEWEPDIVLLQEAPTEDKCEALADRLFGDSGGIVWAHDTVIIVRGRARARMLDVSKRMVMTAGRVILAGGERISVISVRLRPPAAALNLFRPLCWKEHTQDRVQREKQVEMIAEEVGRFGADAAVIAGGDFNVGAGDKSLSALKRQLKDSFDEAGVGWPNTAFNFLPLWRVDQIWVSKGVEVKKVFAVKTKNSDHRMVVCDVNLGISAIGPEE